MTDNLTRRLRERAQTFREMGQRAIEDHYEDVQEAGRKNLALASDLQEAADEIDRYAVHVADMDDDLDKQHSASLTLGMSGYLNKGEMTATTIAAASSIVDQTNARIAELKASLVSLKVAANAYSEDDGTYNSMTLYGAIEQAERVLKKDATHTSGERT